MGEVAGLPKVGRIPSRVPAVVSVIRPRQPLFYLDNSSALNHSRRMAQPKTHLQPLLASLDNGRKGTALRNRELPANTPYVNTTSDMFYNQSMSYKKLAIATLASLPLAFFIVAPKGYLNSPVTGRDIALASPFILEFLGFLFLHVFTTDQGSLSTKEQKLLLLLAGGIFVMLGVPIFAMEIHHPTAGVSPIWLAVLYVYALAGLILNTSEIARSGDLISSYFVHRYALPICLAVMTTFVVFGATAVELNIVTVYLVIKNYIFAIAKQPKR
ncbi:MAG TPA: hypothetical protein VFL85_01365 [Candidatus Saccharimonadales bacterium]|nr:hypothetical protein [Candidatus Saccharimonadales bacterium]